tara:strand:- start:9954 stop:10244 length:291 start_codon:yes stop_codon:yes gene_type:complete
MLKNLVKLANHLDAKGLEKEATAIDLVVKIAISKNNLELLDEAINNLDIIRKEMDPDFAPDSEEIFEDEEVRLFEEKRDAKSLMEEGRLRRDFGLD